MVLHPSRVFALTAQEVWISTRCILSSPESLISTIVEPLSDYPVLNPTCGGLVPPRYCGLQDRWNVGRLVAITVTLLIRAPYMGRQAQIVAVQRWMLNHMSSWNEISVTISDVSNGSSCRHRILRCFLLS